MGQIIIDIPVFRALLNMNDCSASYVKYFYILFPNHITVFNNGQELSAIGDYNIVPVIFEKFICILFNMKICSTKIPSTIQSCGNFSY